MKRLSILLFFAIIFGCKNNDSDTDIMINPDTGAITTDEIEDRFVNNFRDYANITYSIMSENLPDGINFSDFENATHSAFSQWAVETFYLKDANSFNFVYQPNNPNSDIIVRFIDKQNFIDNSSELPNDYCTVIKCLNQNNNDCPGNDCNQKAIAGAQLARSSRYPEFLWSENELNTTYAGNLLLENYWQNILIFNDNTISWAVDSGDGIPNDRFDLESIIAHEIGHRLGFGHATNPNALMHKNFEKGETRSFGAVDRENISQVYPNSLGTFFFIDEISLGNIVVSENNFNNTQNPNLQITSSTSEIFLTFENGLFMPVEMNVLLDDQNVAEMLDPQTWNHTNRRFKIDFSNLTNFHKVNLKAYQNQGTIVQEQLIGGESQILPILKKPGIIAFDQNTGEIVEFYLDGSVNDSHGTISLNAQPLDNGVFNPQTFSYNLFDPSQNLSFSYKLTDDTTNSYALENILLLKYTEEDYFVGIRQSDNTFVRVEPDSGVITALTNLSGSINVSFGSTINEDQNHFIYHNGNQIVVINYTNGDVISQSSVTSPGIGIAYSLENEKYYCITNNEIVEIDLDNGNTIAIPFGASVSGVIPDALFIHPSDNRYYYVATDGLLRGVSLTENISPIIINVTGYRYIKPLY